MESEPGAFGSGAIFEAESQDRISENERIIEDKATNASSIFKIYKFYHNI